MASTRLFINEKTVKKDGKAAVYAQVDMENKSLKINTGLFCSVICRNNVHASK